MSGYMSHSLAFIFLSTRHRNGTTAEGTLAPPPQSQCLAAAGYPWPAETWVIDNQTRIPIGSMYAIYGNIYHQYTPNVSIYTIHGSYGIRCRFSQLVDDQMINLWCLKSILGSGIYSICRLLMAIDVLFPLVGWLVHRGHPPVEANQ